MNGNAHYERFANERRQIVSAFAKAATNKTRAIPIDEVPARWLSEAVYSNGSLYISLVPLGLLGALVLFDKCPNAAALTWYDLSPPIESQISKAREWLSLQD